MTDVHALRQTLQNMSLPVYVIHGEEELLRIEALDEIRASASRQGFVRESYVADGANFDWQECWAQAASAGLFAEYKLLEIHVPSGKLGKQGAEVIQQLAKQPPPATTTVFILPKLDKTQLQSKWFTALAQIGFVYEAKAVTLPSLPAWIRERLQAHHLDMEQDALALFAERVEGNLLAAKQEVDKLALLYPAGHKLDLTEVETAIANVARFDVFQLAAAWMGGDARRVARLLDGLEAEGDEPVLLLWAVAEDIRVLIRLTAALKQGQTVQSVRQELRLWGDKQALASRAVGRIAPSRLVAALQECARIDRQIKGAESGDAWANLKLLLLNLAR